MHIPTEHSDLITVLTQWMRPSPDGLSQTRSTRLQADDLICLASLSLFFGPHEFKQLFKRMHMALEDNKPLFGVSSVQHMPTHLACASAATTAPEFPSEQVERYGPEPEGVPSSGDDDFPDTQAFDEEGEILLPMPMWLGRQPLRPDRH